MPGGTPRPLTALSCETTTYLIPHSRPHDAYPEAGVGAPPLASAPRNSNPHLSAAPGSPPALLGVAREPARTSRHPSSSAGRNALDARTQRHTPRRTTHSSLLYARLARTRCPHSRVRATTRRMTRSARRAAQGAPGRAEKHGRPGSYASFSADDEAGGADGAAFCSCRRVSPSSKRERAMKVSSSSASKVGWGRPSA